MTEAGKKWVQYDKDQNYLRDVLNEEVSCDSREAYKSALRREIERERQILWAPHYSSYDLKAIQTLDKVLELLDTVEPTSESKEPKP